MTAFSFAQPPIESLRRKSEYAIVSFSKDPPLVLSPRQPSSCRGLPSGSPEVIERASAKRSYLYLHRNARNVFLSPLYRGLLRVAAV